MAAFSPPRLFAAWRVEAPFFCGFPFRWVLHFVLSLTRGVVLHASASCSREDSLDECGRPCDTILPSLFCPVASVQPIQIGAGDPVCEGD